MGSKSRFLKKPGRRSLGHGLVLNEEGRKCFLQKVNREGPIPDPTNPHYMGLGPCHLWKAYKNPSGYGVLTLGKKIRLAHRVSWVLHHGDLPSGKAVLHKCDNPACVNPDHLRIGSNVDNILDRIEKKRTASGPTHGSVTKPESTPRGERHHWAKLKESEVSEIRRLYAEEGLTFREIARQFGIHKDSIGPIISGSRWGQSFDEKPSERFSTDTGAKFLGIHRNSLTHHARKLGIIPQKTRRAFGGTTWSLDDLERIRNRMAESRRHLSDCQFQSRQSGRLK
jgi:hypothetical protein